MLNDDYRDILSAFDEAGVEHLVIGAYALAAHGHPRATGDRDLWVRPTARAARQIRIGGQDDLMPPGTDLCGTTIDRLCESQRRQEGTRTSSASLPEPLRYPSARGVVAGSMRAARPAW
jgi:hypothetical protein